MKRIALLTTLLSAIILIAASSATFKNPFFFNDDMTYGIELDYQHLPDRYLQVWVGDGNGGWGPNPLHFYKLEFDHSWFCVWRGVYTNRELWTAFGGPDYVQMYLVDIGWLSESMVRTEFSPVMS